MSRAVEEIIQGVDQLMKKAVDELAFAAVRILQEKGLFVTTVESCTGGGIANAITNVVGSSEVMKQAFITYSTAAKLQLGVPLHTIQRNSVYSIETAMAMVTAGLQKAVRADISVGVTGSLTRVDQVNEGSELGGVFLAIGNKTTTFADSLRVPLGLSRADAKDFIIKAALARMIIMARSM